MKIKNLIILRDTFHQAGVASKSAVTRGVPRWICQPCIERKSESIYKSQRVDAIEARKRNEQR